MAKVLVIDDDPMITESLSEGLVPAGYIVDVAHNAADAENILAGSHYDCLIVDWQMPGKSGAQLVEDLRRRGTTCAILMLTGKASLDDKVKGLDVGADDYLTKPFALREVLSRLRALLRRPPQLQEDELRGAGIVINRTSRQVSCQGEQVSLTRQEYLLLEYLMTNRNRICSVDLLVNAAWSSMSESSSDTVRVHMANLRKKIKRGQDECPIRTVHGQGYVFTEE